MRKESNPYCLFFHFIEFLQSNMFEKGIKILRTHKIKHLWVQIFHLVHSFIQLITCTKTIHIPPRTYTFIWSKKSDEPPLLLQIIPSFRLTDDRTCPVANENGGIETSPWKLVKPSCNEFIAGWKKGATLDKISGWRAITTVCRRRMDLVFEERSENRAD